MARVLAALLLPVVLPLAVIGLNRPLVGEPVPVLQERKTELVWADRVFTSQPEFAQFLSARGASYETWAANHPGAAPWEQGTARPRDVFAAWAAASCLALLLLFGRPRLGLRARAASARRLAPRFAPPRPPVRAGLALAASAAAAVAATGASAARRVRGWLAGGASPRVDVLAHIAAAPRSAARRARRGLGERSPQRFGAVSYAATAGIAAPRAREPHPELAAALVTAPASAMRRMRRELADRGVMLIVFYVLGAILAIGVGPFIIVVMSRM